MLYDHIFFLKKQQFYNKTDHNCKQNDHVCTEMEYFSSNGFA